MDDKSTFISSFEQHLIADFTSDDIFKIRNALLIAIQPYDISKKDCELITVDSSNDGLIMSFCACCKIDGKSDRSIREYYRVISKFSESVRKSLLTVDSRDIRTYLAIEMSRGISNTTAENIRCYISAFYKWLTSDGLITTNPCTAIKSIKCKKMVKLPFTDIEIDAMRSLQLTPRDRSIIELLLSSGVRASELENLNISDINFLERKVLVRDGKGGKDRITYMSNIASHYLQEYIESRTDTDEALFITRNKTRFGVSALANLLNTVGERAHITHIHPHKFRRTFATNLYNNSMDLHEIQRLMGHSDIATTLMYISSDDERLKLSYQKHVM